MVSLLISFDVHTTLVSVISLYCPTYLLMIPILVYNASVRYSLQYSALYALVYQPKHNFDLHACALPYEMHLYSNSQCLIMIFDVKK